MCVGVCVCVCVWVDAYLFIYLFVVDSLYRGCGVGRNSAMLWSS